RSYRQRSRPLHRPVLHCRNPIRSLRCRNHFSVSLGRQVQGSRPLRSARDADLPRHPCRWLHLGLGKRRAGMGVTPSPPASEPSTESFAASRWTQGNFLFPTRLVVSPLRVSRVKSRLFGSNDESIAISKIASVHISTGVLWAEIRIESTGGTDPITSHGHRKADAQRIRDLIESYQAQSRV